MAGKATRTDGIYQLMRADILGGRLEPGQRLKFPDIAKRYVTSVGVAREALTRLVADGFVLVRAHQGFTVTPLSHADLADLTRARVEVESLVLRLSVLEGDMKWEADLLAAHHMLERTPLPVADDPGIGWSAAHSAFHLALIQGCRNQRLLGIATGLRESAELYLHWAVSFGRQPKRNVAGEHRALLDAALAREAERAAELLRDHIAHTAQLLIRGAPDAPNTPHKESAKRSS